MKLEHVIRRVCVYNLHNLSCENEKMLRIHLDLNLNIDGISNFGINLDMSEYMGIGHVIFKNFTNENDLIEELHRLNSIGLNIKG